MFTQHININNIAGNQEIMKICATHPECIGCPLLNEDKQIGNSVVRCENAFAKRCNNG